MAEVIGDETKTRREALRDWAEILLEGANETSEYCS